MRVSNTLSRQKEEFIPSNDPVKMYVCGVTAYDECHVGHAMSYIVFDVVRRYLEYRGYRVYHVQNFTDIDDKIIARARRLETSPQELAESVIQRYFADMDALNIQRAHCYPRVTQEITAIIALIQTLISKGSAYQANGDVYFRVKSHVGYGRLSRRTVEGTTMGSRVAAEAGKEYSMDFALWKAAKPGEPQWESPWGPGRPGWHIECSAMALRYLGETVDIHGGGQDLIFPHHENELAQSEAATGTAPFVRYWFHNGLLQLGEVKMSKSLGNLVTVRETLAHYSPDALRLFVLGSHYRSPLTYGDEAMASWQRGAGRLREAARPTGSQVSSAQAAADPFRRRFLEAMDDDFNTPQAVAVLFELAREINRGREEGAAVEELQETLQELAGVLGLTFAEPLEEPLARPFIELLLKVRAELRSAKQYSLADQIRADLGEMGITLDDTPQGTGWKQRRPEQ